VARQPRHGDAVLLGHQTELAVGRALQERHAGYRTGPVDEEASRSRQMRRHGKRRVYMLSGDAVRELLAAARHLAAQPQSGGSRREKAASAAGG
jgi:hypothetical protein